MTGPVVGSGGVRGWARRPTFCFAALRMTDGRGISGVSDTARARVEAIVAPALAAMGYALVRLKLGGGRPQVLQIMVERADGSGVGIDDCAAISRRLSAVPH